MSAFHTIRYKSIIIKTNAPCFKSFAVSSYGHSTVRGSRIALVDYCRCCPCWSLSRYLQSVLQECLKQWRITNRSSEFTLGPHHFLDDKWFTASFCDRVTVSLLHRKKLWGTTNRSLFASLFWVFTKSLQGRWNAFLSILSKSQLHTYYAVLTGCLSSLSLASLFVLKHSCCVLCHWDRHGRAMLRMRATEIMREGNLSCSVRRAFSTKVVPSCHNQSRSDINRFVI